MPLRLLAAEITREKIFERLHDELPYASTVATELWKDMPDGSVRIEQTIYVMREGHKKIVIGEGGRTIKAIGLRRARRLSRRPDKRCISFCLLKCARTGETIPNATGKWDWIFRRGDRRLRVSLNFCL